MDVLVIGRSESLYDTATFIAARHRVVGILTAPASPEFKRTERDFEKLASTLGCAFHCCSQIDDSALAFVARVRAQIGVSSHWLDTLQGDIFDLIPGGILNAHHGDLPRYRGNAALNWMLLCGEPRIYAMIHFMEPGKLDSGDIVARRPFDVGDDASILDVLEFIERNVPEMFREVLDQVETGTLRRIPQDSAGKRPFRCYPRLPAHGKIDWGKPARDIHRLVRASTRPYRGAYSYLKVGGIIRTLTIWESRLVADNAEDLGVPGHVIRNDRETGESWVHTGRGVLALRLVQLDEDPPFQPGKVWKSIRFGFGVDLEAELIACQRKLAERGL